MSLIFKSLQKLDARRFAGMPGQLPVATPPQDLPGFYGSPSFTKRALRVAMLAAGFIVLGFGAVVAVEYLTGRKELSPGTPPAMAAAADLALAPAGATPPPAMTRESQKKEDPPGQARYFAPETEPAGTRQPGAHRQPAPLALEQPRPALAAVAAPADQPTQPALPLVQADGQAEQRRLNALDHNARAGQLAHQTQAAMAREPINAAQVEALLEELARIKGSDHPFVRKLSAYYLLKQQRYDQAAALLKQVIAASPDDVEAGINLALIDIHHGRVSEARQRLKHLGVEHPDNAAVADMIRKLPP